MGKLGQSLFKFLTSIFAPSKQESTLKYTQLPRNYADRLKVNVGNDQEMSQSERNPNPKTEPSGEKTKLTIRYLY